MNIYFKGIRMYCHSSWENFWQEEKNSKMRQTEKLGVVPELLRCSHNGYFGISVGSRQGVAECS